MVQGAVRSSSSARTQPVQVYSKNTVANPKNRKNPSESVAKVSNTDDPTAGSLPKRSRSNGISTPRAARSEEHTSELQSLMRISYAGFCLKKKNKKKNQ